MPLTLSEIQPGIVAVIDPAILAKTGVENKVTRKGPFVCVREENGESAWLAVTTRPQANYSRLSIKSEWRIAGGPVWRNRDQYLSDARQMLTGPNSSFVAAAAAEWPYHHGRPGVTQEALNAIWSEIESLQKVGN